MLAYEIHTNLTARKDSAEKPSVTNLTLLQQKAADQGERSARIAFPDNHSCLLSADSHRSGFSLASLSVRDVRSELKTSSGLVGPIRRFPTESGQ